MKAMDWISIIPVDILLVVVTAIVTYFTTKRKSRAESKNLENQNIGTIFTTYNVELQSMKKRINEYVNRIDELDETVKHLIAEKKLLKSELNKLEEKYGIKNKNINN